MTVYECPICYSDMKQDPFNKSGYNVYVCDACAYNAEYHFLRGFWAGYKRGKEK